MTEQTDIDVKPEREINWSFVEAEYRAGVRSLRDIAAEAGITEGAIRQKAKRLDWTRDLTARIHNKAEELVRKEELRSTLRTEELRSAASEKQIVDINAHAVATVDLTNRKDVKLAIDIARTQLEELACLGDPNFKATLEWIGQCMDRGEDGKVDKVNETYQYIISLAGRVKIAKEIAASVGTYIPMQRKMLKLDVDTQNGLSGIDTLLLKVNAQNAR